MTQSNKARQQQREHTAHAVTLNVAPCNAMTLQEANQWLLDARRRLAQSRRPQRQRAGVRHG